MSAPEGIFESSVTNWLNTSVDGAVGPYSWEIIAGGHSNLTFLVTDANSRRLVLRRPPLAHGLASAHDMAREHRIISALNRSSVPVPTTVGLCEDDSINGAPFYVMEYVEGHVVRDVESAARLLSESARARASESLADTLAAIHEVDLVAVGLNDLGRHGITSPAQASW